MTEFEWIRETGALGVLILVFVGIFRFMMRLFEHRKNQDDILQAQIAVNARMQAELSTIKTLMIRAGMADKRDFPPKNEKGGDAT